MMEIGFTSLVCTPFLIAVISYFMVSRCKRKNQCVLRLPPGSMGLPYIGETLRLYSDDPSVFFINRQKRYGDIFKTRILGCPCVMLASPEAAQFVLVSQAHLFKPTYPPSKERMIGPSALFFHDGKYHDQLRRLVKSSLAPDTIRGLLPDIESLVVSTLDSWNTRVLSTFQIMKQFAFDVAVLTIFGGQLEAHYQQDLKMNYMILDKGYNSLPTNIPGTLYSKAIKARKRLQEILQEIISERRKEEVAEKNLLGCLMTYENDKEECMSDDQIADNIIGVVFAAQDTTASVLTWIIKYLHDNPKLLEAVKTEQMAIHEENQNGIRPLTWAQTRRMSLTQRVISETLRMSSIISFTFREAVCDIEYKGYLIPKGWKVMPLFRNIHHNPEFFQDPEKFDPSRFKTSPKPNTFIPFGNGIHSCPGNELAKLEILVLIHHLVTKYRFDVVKPQKGVEYRPFPVPKNGLNVRLQRESN